MKIIKRTLISTIKEKYMLENGVEITSFYADKPLRFDFVLQDNNPKELIQTINKYVNDKNLARLILAIAHQEQSALNPKMKHPNNNYWGIQTDSGRWLASAYIDYRFIAKDKDRYREFAGFDSLDRAVLFMKNMLNLSFANNLKGNRVPSDKEFPDWYAKYWLGRNIDDKVKQNLLAVYKEVSKYV
jgi:hypothetical protein